MGIGNGNAATAPYGHVLWFTGLSGAGKTTLAVALAEELRKRGVCVEHLDGDTLRAQIPSTGFSKADRLDHARRAGALAASHAEQGRTVIASLITPYAESRAELRALCPNFVEVYVSTPLEVCETRDVKGLYRKARRGEILHFTGIDDPYEVPESPDLRIDTTELSVEEGTATLLRYLNYGDKSASAPEAQSTERAWTP